jgi:hypothetical protein
VVAFAIAAAGCATEEDGAIAEGVTDEGVDATGAGLASQEVEYSILRPGNRYVGSVGDRYLDEVQPALAARCAVCHACTNGPCQLNMTSFAALERGINSKNPYSWGVVDNYPTRVSDNRPLSMWREKGFKSVLPAAGSDPESSVFFKSLALGDANTPSNDPNAGPLRASTVRQMARDQDSGSYSCPSSSLDWWWYELRHPQGGMPWGLPVHGEDHATLQAWALDGAPGPSTAARTAIQRPQTTALTQGDPAAMIAQWDAFLGADDLRSQLVARYIYEHSYSANIHFRESPGEFYRIVRSRTPAPAAIDLIHTDMPQDNPGVSRVYFRLEKIDRVIEGKTHVPWELGLSDLAHFRELFLSGSWTLFQLPGYSTNPFEVFEAIPAAARARFMIENSQMIFAGFARGPICLVQPASYAVDEHFWIWFMKPEVDPTVIDPKLGLDSWAPFFTKDSNHLGGIPVLGDKYGEPIYREAFERTLRRVKPEGIGFSDIWLGDGDPDAWLTVHRNQISVDVHTTRERPVTGLPKSVWFMTYANFERMYYNAVAQYKYWGSALHQNDSFNWQTYTRTEAEDLYASLFPDQSYREQLRDRMTSFQGKVYNKLFTDYALGRPSTSPQYRTEDALARALIAGQGSAFGDDDRLNNWPTQRPTAVAPTITSVDQWEAGVRTVTNRVLPFGKFFPNIVHVRLDGQHLYTFLAIRGFRYDKIPSAEALARTRDTDYVVAVPGFSGYEAHMFVDLSYAQAPAFLNELAAVRDQAGWNRFNDRYKIGRNSPRFWDFVDWIHAWQAEHMPVRAALMELRAYDKDETPF